MNDNLLVLVEPCEEEYMLGNDLALDVKLFNDGTEDLFLKGPFLPEGYKIRIYVKDAQGINVHASPAVKIEKRGTAYENFCVPPSHFVGARFVLSAREGAAVRFPAGDYFVESVYQNADRDGDNGVVTGLFKSELVRITVRDT